jgi:hypothetical protein
MVDAVRQKKAVAVFPRPTAGPLRPVVHSQTLKYNAKIRAGRGFTLEELKVLISLGVYCTGFDFFKSLCDMNDLEFLMVHVQMRLIWCEATRRE